jgi:hypothetical protein
MKHHLAFLLLVFAILLSGLAGFMHFRNGHDWGDDFALYIHQAKALTEGKVKEVKQLNSIAVEKSGVLLGPHLYPWGFPVLLAPVVFVFGIDGILPMKMLNLLLFILSLILAYYTFSERSRLVALLVVAVLGLHPLVLPILDEILSDFLFLFLTLLSLLIFEKYFAGRRDASIKIQMIIGAIMFAAFFTRPLGALLLPVLASMQLIGLFKTHQENLNWKKCLLPYATFGVLYLMYRIFLPVDDSTHASFLYTTNSDTLSFNCEYYFDWLPKQFLIKEWLLYTVLPFLAIGLWVEFKNRYYLHLFFLLMIGIYLWWPAVQGIRFVFPILPVFLFFIFSGFEATCGRLFKNRLPLILAGSTLALFFAEKSFRNSFQVQGLKNITQEGPYDSGALELWNFIRKELPEGVLIAFFKPRVLTLKTLRPAFAPASMDEVYFNQADYLFLHKRAYGGDQLLDHQDTSIINNPELVKVFENEDFIGWRIGE